MDKILSEGGDSQNIVQSKNTLVNKEQNLQKIGHNEKVKKTMKESKNIP